MGAAVRWVRGQGQLRRVGTHRCRVAALRAQLLVLRLQRPLQLVACPLETLLLTSQGILTRPLQSLGLRLGVQSRLLQPTLELLQ